MTRTMITSLIATALFFSTSEKAPGMDYTCHTAPPDLCASQTTPRGPECGIELTCAGGPVQLGYSGGVCFRATCPGVWGVLHERTDQASFKRRLFTYRHYAFRGDWELKDQGVIEAGPVQQRALFLALPGDLIQFKLSDPDCNAKIEIKNLGYIKTGNLCELQEWLAYNLHMEKSQLNGRE